MKRNTLIKDAQMTGVPRLLIRLIKMPIKDTGAAVMDKDGTRGNLQSILRQGKGLSTAVFNMAIERGGASMQF